VEGMLAAEAVQVPSALFLWGPVGTDEPPELRLMPEDLSGSYPRYGLPELSGKLVRHVIDPCPAAIRPPTEAVRLPVRYVPYNGGGALPPWLLAEPGRPRVCLTWSTALTRMSGPRSYLLPSLVDALAPLDVELVVTATRQDVAALGPVPGSVRVLENCPLGLLLPSCAAVVHHGGAGSTMTAIGAGVPQLAITFATEQTANARRLAATGAGLTMLGHEADPDRVRSAVQALVTDPRYRRRAGTLQADLRARPVPARLVGTLTLLAG
jgi:UDP:flavonoid glycosyltransferase YjiC (YdhE family)